MFLNPLMLFGALAISVPIIIHLLNRHQIKRVAWAAMRFLKISIEQNQRRMRIEDMLLLALRCLILAMLAVALARPTLQASSSAAGLLGGGGVTAVIVIDNSLSMGCTDGVATRFDLAKQAGEQVLDSLPGSSSVALLLAGDIVDGLIPEPTLDLNLARKMIREARISDRSTQLSSAFARGIEILQRKESAGRELYVITDAQRNGFEGMSDIYKRVDEAKPQVGTHLIVVGTEEPRNLCISDLRFAGGLVVAQQPLRFETRITNNGTAQVRDIHVNLRVGVEQPCDEGVIDSIPPGESRTISLFAKLREAGTHAVRAEIAPDHLPADDARVIVVRAIDNASVLLVSGDGRKNDREGDAFFLRHALQPVTPAERPGYFVKVTECSSADLASVKWNDFEVIFFADVPDLSGSVADSLADFVKKGGGLVVFPGSKTLLTFYNNQLVDRLGMLPAKMADARGDATQDQKFFALSTKGFEHPIATIWNDEAAGTPSAARFYRAYGLTPLPEAKSVLNWADGTPAVLERDVGLGRVILFSSTANTEWNDLPVRPGLFVPLISRSIGRLIARQDDALNLRVGQKFLDRLPIDLIGKDVSITTPDTSAPRQSRQVELMNAQALVQFDDTHLAGVYTVEVQGQSPMQFAASINPEESKLAQLTEEQLALLGDHLTVTRWQPGVALQQTLITGRSGTELWMPIVLAVLALAVMESVLATWFSRSK